MLTAMTLCSRSKKERANPPALLATLSNAVMLLDLNTQTLTRIYIHLMNSELLSVEDKRCVASELTETEMRKTTGFYPAQTSKKASCSKVEISSICSIRLLALTCTPISKETTTHVTLDKGVLN